MTALSPAEANAALKEAGVPVLISGQQADELLRGLGLLPTGVRRCGTPQSTSRIDLAHDIARRMRANEVAAARRAAR